MIGDILSSEMIGQISEITGIERSKIKIMAIDDIRFYVAALTMRTGEHLDLEDESSVDHVTPLEILESLNNL